eukprot:TRINITY_DN5484_c0_g1_i5.p1 TRINITY_DN5484_c0_g1~~TRINITY_DN5484_c0_g1_i5.p1  ORF type:complete len:107 (+),score=17.06 TRINITY_DN5484_c0_g1_i5:27-347(+)
MSQSSRHSCWESLLRKDLRVDFKDAPLTLRISQGLMHGYVFELVKTNLEVVEREGERERERERERENEVYLCDTLRGKRACISLVPLFWKEAFCFSLLMHTFRQIN